MAMSEEAAALIARFDARLESTDAILERNTQAFERNAQAFEQNNRAWGHTVAAMKAIRDELADHRDETRAQTQAILRMLDRWDEGPRKA